MAALSCDTWRDCQGHWLAFQPHMPALQCSQNPFNLLVVHDQFV
jgi:heme A synthase